MASEWTVASKPLSHIWKIEDITQIFKNERKAKVNKNLLSISHSL